MHGEAITGTICTLVFWEIKYVQKKDIGKEYTLFEGGGMKKHSPAPK